MQCPSAAELDAILTSGDDTARAELDRHVDGCAACRARNFGETIDALPNRGRKSVGRSRPPRLEKGASFGRYVILELLGSGGMGEVYAAWDPQLDRKVALKRVRPGNREGSGDEARSRLLREARALARLSHPNVVSVHEVAEHDGAVFLAMEHVDGVSLERWLKSERRTMREVLEVFRAAGLGLAAAHDAGLIHRDFKPQNVLIGRDGRIRVLDFGLARDEGGDEQPGEDSAPAERSRSSSDSTERLTIVTQDGLVVGTPGYMAPEQLRGDPLDARTDQYAFCVCLFEALYGVAPFTAKSPAALVPEMEAERIASAPADRKVPRPIHRALVRGLSASPERRFPSMRALVTALDAWQRRAVGRAAAIAIGVVAGAAFSAAGFAVTAPTPRSIQVPASADDAPLLEEIAEARAAFAAGQIEDAFNRANRIAAASARAPYAAAEADLLLASVYQIRGARPDAEAALHRAAQRAETLGDDELRARAFIALVKVVGVYGHRPEEARRWADYAHAVLRRAGTSANPALEEQLRLSEQRIGATAKAE